MQVKVIQQRKLQEKKKQVKLSKLQEVCRKNGIVNREI